MGLFGFKLFLTLLLAPMILYDTVGVGECPIGLSSLDDSNRTTLSELKMSRIVSKSVPSRIEGRKQNIPYLFHQTNEGDQLPADMLMAIETVRQQNPEYAHRYYNGTERRQFLEKHMGPTVLACYDKLLPKAYKADLFRYSAVLIHGGCYADIGFLFILPLRVALQINDRFVSTPDGLGDGTRLNSAFFCAEPGHPIIQMTIQKIVEHVSTSNFTEDMLGVTGPIAFMEGFRKYFNISIYNHERSSAQFANGVRLLRQELSGCWIYPIYDHDNGTVILFHKYPRFRIDMRVLSNKISYGPMWNERNVFNESVVVPTDGKYLIGK